MAEPGTTNGADPQGTAAPVTNPAPGAEAPAPGDYLARIRSEPDFAVEQIREKDRKVTEISQREKALTKKFGPLVGVIDQLGGGDRVYRELVRLNNVLGNKALREMIETYESTGTLPAGGQAGYGMDPEPEDPQTQQIRELRNELQQLKGQITQTRGSVGKQSILVALGKLRDEFPEDFDTVIRPYIESEVERFEQTPSGMELLNTLGYDQLRNMAYIAMGPKLPEIGKRVYLRELENLKRSATGAPGTTTTTGRELPAGSKHSTAREALAEFERQGMGRG